MPAIAPTMGRSTTKSVVAACFAVLLTEGFDLAMFGSVVPALLEYEPWQLSPTMVGYMGSIAVLGMLIGAATAAAIADRIGRRPVVIAAVTLFSVAMGISAVAPNPELFLIMRLLIGIGTGAVMPTVAATLIEFADPARRNTTMALGFIGVGVGGMMSGILSVLLVPSFGFRAMCLVGFLPLLVLVPVLLRFFPESPALLRNKGRVAEAEALAKTYGIELAAPAVKKGTATSGRLGEVFGQGRAVGTVLFWAATFSCLLVTFGVSAWLPQLMKSGGYGMAASLSAITVLKGGAVVGVLIAAKLADLFGQKLVVVTTFGAAALALLALSYSPPLWIAYVLIAVLGLGTTGLQTLINAVVGGYYPAQVRATGLGLNLSIGRIGGIVGPTYLAWLVASGIDFQGKFYALAIPALIGGVFMLLVPGTKVAPTVSSTTSELRPPSSVVPAGR